MIARHLVILPAAVLWLLLSSASGAQLDSVAGSSTGVSTLRISLLAGVTISAAGVVYVARYEPLFKSHFTSFFFREDYSYALNQDKLLHAYGGAVGSAVWSEAYLSSGVAEHDAAIYGAATSFAFLTFMKIEDGHVDYLGFDRADELGNLLGSAYPLVQYHVPYLLSFTPKASYRPSSNDVVEAGQSTPGFLEDHEGQKFWLGVTVHDILPRELKPYWPPLLGIAIGRAVEGLQRGKPSAGMYVALDLDLRKLPGKSPLLRKVWTFLNYVHLPMPAVRVSPSVVWYGFYW
jgi:Predicted periplasmic lipoprotein (DUF2279)